MPKKTKPSRGRPRLKPGQATETVKIRLAASDVEQVLDRAQADGVSYAGYASASLWIRALVLRDLSNAPKDLCSCPTTHKPDCWLILDAEAGQ